VALHGIDLAVENATLKFSPPLANLSLNSTKSSCLCNNLDIDYYKAWFTFTPVPAALIGSNMTACVWAANGLAITDWVLVGHIRPTPVLLPTANITWLELTESWLTLHGLHLGLRPRNGSNLFNHNVPKLVFVDSVNNSHHYEGMVECINANATLLVFCFYQGVYVLGMLSACLSVWFMTSLLVPVATVVLLPPDNTSSLYCPPFAYVDGVVMCSIHIKGCDLDTVGSLKDFNVQLCNMPSLLLMHWLDQRAVCVE
jgi:hypothetical protein